MRIDLRTCGRILLRYAILTVIFAAGIVIARLCWAKINLPFRDPWQVLGPPYILKFNPNTNCVRYLLVALAPTLLLLIVYLVPIGKLRNLLFGAGNKPESVPQNVLFRKRVAETPAAPTAKVFGKTSRVRAIVLAVALVSLMCVFSLALPTDTASGDFDTFHEGESLAPAVAYMHGQVPYADFLTLHGFFQDAGRSVLAFKLFGRSIAATRTLWSIVKVFTFGLIAVLMIVICEGNYALAFAGGLVFMFMASYLMPIAEGYDSPVLKIIGRDFTNVSFLIAVLLLYRQLIKPVLRQTQLALAGFLLAFITFGALSVSVDRGSYLLGCYAVLSPLLYLTLVRKRARNERLMYLIFSAAGALAAILMLGAIIHWRFDVFLPYSFRIVPQYFPLMDTRPYPIENLPWFAMLILIAGNTFWVMLKYLRERCAVDPEGRSSARRFVESYFAELALLVVSLILYLSALGISDWIHASIYGTTALILSLTIILRHGVPRLFKARIISKVFSGVLAVAALATLGSAVSVISEVKLIGENFPLGKPDSEYVPINHIDTLAFLKANLRPDENFYTMSSEGSWYYFLDKPCPTRFANTYSAATNFYQREVVRDLARHNVKFIIYSNSHWTNRILGIPTLLRLPIVTDYIRKHYAPYRRIDDNEIWARKSG